MPSSEESNKAFNEATTEVLQILAKALQLTNGAAGHLDMAKEMVTIMIRMSSLVMNSYLIHLRLRHFKHMHTIELMEHVDHVSQSSFLSVPVWKNIKSNDQHIEHHQLYLKAYKAIIVLIPMPILQAPPVKLPTDPAVLPSGVAKSKTPSRSIVWKTLMMVCSDSDEVEIIEGMTQSNDLQKRKHTSSGTTESELVATSTQSTRDVIAPVMAENDMAKDVAPGNTDTMPTQPKGKAKSKWVEIVILSGSDITMDRKGKGKEVVLPVETDWGIVGRRSLEINHEMGEYCNNHDMSKEHQAMATTESVGDIGIVLEANIRANTANAAIPHMPPRQSQSPPSFARDMDIDLAGDTVARDLQAMTLEVKTGLKSLLTVV
ncbi:hypothetical protein BDR06DRAFT_969760 [Suillus hirtellus]|nr:hypothetical protein BDR06DRAFT_969760 [Suillus hirtellus]